MQGLAEKMCGCSVKSTTGDQPGSHGVTHAPAPNRKNLLEHYEYLKKWENKAFEYLHPIDWEKIDPCIAPCETEKELHVFNYFRITTSFLHQQMTDIKKSRATRFFVADYKTGTILGLVLHGDIYDQWKIRDDFIGWNKHFRSRNINKILHIQKALPLLGLGKYLIGRLLILMAISRETIRYVSLKYSQPICVITMSGIGLKRLTYCERMLGIEFVGYHDKYERSCSLYSYEAIKGGYRHLRGEISEKKLRLKAKPMSENISYWKDRWLYPRLKKIDNKNFDPNSYRLEALLEAAT